VAQGWADHLAGNNCAMYHSGNGLGENIYQASALMWPDGQREFRAVPSFRPVDAWGEEKQWHNAETGKCSATGKNTCGHYTQVVWKDTTEVGCAMAVCGNNAQIWVCNYSPAGNIAGRNLFERGKR
jgi:pathogenesis-related protein 1